jgi:outer membrane protein
MYAIEYPHRKSTQPLARRRAARGGAMSARIPARVVATVLRAIGIAMIVPLIAAAQSQPIRLSLPDAIRLARSQSTTAQLAGIRAEEVEARVTQRRADLLPFASAIASDGERTFNTASFGIPFPGFDPNGSIIGPVRTVDIRARIGMNLYDPAARARYHSAQVVADSAAAAREAAMDAAALTAGAAYLRALRAEALVNARSADSASAAQLLTIAREVLTAGVGVALDVTRAEAQLAGVRTQLAAARSESRQAELALRRAIGASLDQAVVLSDSLERPLRAVPSQTDAIAIALRTRPELRAAASGARAARLSRDAARAARLPTIGAFADEGLTSASYTHLLRTHSLGLQVSVPLFEGRRTEGRVDETSAMVREAELRLADATDQVSVEVRSALIDIGSASEQVELARERLRLAEAELAQAQERFRAGVAGNADAITALLALTASRAQLIDAETALRYSHLSLARAEGLLLDIQ